jgi:hypothetical protein
MRLSLIDPPSPFDDLATWERHLADVRRLPDDVALREAIEASRASGRANKKPGG